MSSSLHRLRIVFIGISVLVASAEAATAAREEKKYDPLAMASIDLTDEDYDDLERDPEAKLEELHRLSRECQLEEPGVELLSGERTKREKNAPTLSDYNSDALKKNDLMRQMNHFFGGVQSYKDNDTDNPSLAVHNAMLKAMGNLNEEERDIFRKSMALVMFSVALVSVWLLGCLCICCCGYETVTTKYIPCCGCMVRALCWPAICCCQIGVNGTRGCWRFARAFCGRCKSQWKRRPWKAIKINK